MIKKLGAITSQIKGYALGQLVFVVLDSRKENGTILFVSIGKDPAERLARRYRNGLEPAMFKQACLKQGYVSGEGEITLIGVK